MWSLSERTLRFPVMTLLSLLLFMSIVLGGKAVEALPCAQCCEIAESGDATEEFMRIFCPNPCAPGVEAFCVVKIMMQEHQVTNCPDAICALLTPEQAMCCDDDYCRFRIRELVEVVVCTCASCEAWVWEMEGSGELYTSCLGEDRLTCEEADPQCCDDE